MRRIFKYLIAEADCDNKVRIKMPRQSNILTLQVQNGVPHIWVSTPANEEEEILRVFEIVGTGWFYDPRNKPYIGTWQEDIYVWHLFECPEEATPEPKV